MNSKLFYPAPSEFPIPINPPRGNDEILTLLSETDWCRVLRLRSDRLVRVGAFWLFGFLDEAHYLAQQESSPEGAYWHALIHRSEGDFRNSLYWFNRVGAHPLYKILQVQAKQVTKGPRSAAQWRGLLECGEWSPRQFVALCERTMKSGSGPLEILQQVAQLEYNLLMEFILSKAKA